MAFAPLSPELKQRALSIASSFAKGGTVATKPVARFRDGADVDVDDDYGTFGADELSNDDPMGMAAAVAEAEAKAATSGMSDKERDFAAEVAIEDLDRGEGGGSLEERNRAIQSLLDQAERDSAPPPDTGDTETGRFGGPKPTVENLPAAIEAAEKAGAVSLAAMMQNKLNELQAAQTTSEPVSVTKAATQVDPIDFLASGMGDPSRDFDRTTGPAAPQVDADDMAGIGSVAPRSAVQAPLAGGIAEVEPEFQQARTPDELDEIQDFEDMAAAQQAAGVGLQGKKAGLAGLGVLAGSPIAAVGPVARDIFKTLTQPDVKAGELLAGKGLGRDQTAQEVVNEKGERVGVVVSDPSGVVSIQPTSIEAAFDPALRDAYSKMNERRQEEREARDQGGDEPITEEDVAQILEEETEEPKFKFEFTRYRPEDFYYFNPGQSVGLPSVMTPRS